MTNTLCDTKLSFEQVEMRAKVGRRRRSTALEKGGVAGALSMPGFLLPRLRSSVASSSQHLLCGLRAKEGREDSADEVARGCLCRLSRLRRR